MSLKNSYRFIIPLSMCYIGLSLMASSLVHKIVYIGHHIASAGSFVMPFWFILCDIITEVYGYEISRRMLWSLMLVGFIIYSCLQFFAVLEVNQSTGRTAYYFVFGSMLRTYFAIWISLFIANFINTYTISKLKILMNSRHFWLRSLAASAIGEILYTIIGFYGILGGTISNFELWKLISVGCLLKITITALMAIPATIFAGILKKSEGIDILDTNVNYNPFKIEF